MLSIILSLQKNNNMKTLFLTALILISFSLSAKKSEIYSQNCNKFCQFKIDSRIELLLNINLREHRLFNLDKDYNSFCRSYLSNMQKGENDRSFSKNIIMYYMLSFKESEYSPSFSPFQEYLYEL